MFFDLLQFFKALFSLPQLLRQLLTGIVGTKELVLTVVDSLGLLQQLVDGGVDALFVITAFA